MAQYDALKELDDVPESWIDDMLETDGFVERFLRNHRKLIWNNIRNVSLLSTPTRLRNFQGIFTTNNGRNNIYRGDTVSCLDEPLVVVDGVIQTTTDGNAQREGRRDIVPFWNPTTTVPACGFLAQETLISASGIDCSSQDGRMDPGCGCGPNLQWCGRTTDIQTVLSSFTTAVEKTMEYLVKQNRPYTELFTTRVGFVNGPIVHYWKHWTRMSSGVRNVPVPLDNTALPDLPFTAVDEWVQVTLPEYHAGILTSPSFLLRFQTNRARASQFYTQFLCSPFQPPAAPLPVADEAALNQPDLQLRAGCKYCHAVLEPTAAYWGRWAQQGAGLLYPEDFPASNDECRLCATTGATCPDACSRYYHTVSLDPADQEFLGMLESMVFLRNEHTANVDEGPKLMAMRAVATNELPRCTVQTAANTLLGRKLSSDEMRLLNEWVTAFSTSDYSYKSLMKTIVTSALYRRVK